MSNALMVFGLVFTVIAALTFWRGTMRFGGQVFGASLDGIFVRFLSSLQLVAGVVMLLVGIGLRAGHNLYNIGEVVLFAGPATMIFTYISGFIVSTLHTDL